MVVLFFTILGKSVDAVFGSMERKCFDFSQGQAAVEAAKLTDVG